MSTPSRIDLRTPDIVVERLKHLHDTMGLSWFKIAATEEFAPVPAGTLCTIAKTGKVLRKWRRHLRVRNDMRPRVIIHKKNMISAANTILKHLGPDDVTHLINILVKEVYGEIQNR